MSRNLRTPTSMEIDGPALAGPLPAGFQLAPPPAPVRRQLQEERENNRALLSRMAALESTVAVLESTVAEQSRQLDVQSRQLDMQSRQLATLLKTVAEQGAQLFFADLRIKGLEANAEALKQLLPELKVIFKDREQPAAAKAASLARSASAGGPSRQGLRSDLMARSQPRFFGDLDRQRRSEAIFG